MSLVVLAGWVQVCFSEITITKDLTPVLQDPSAAGYARHAQGRSVFEWITVAKSRLYISITIIG